MWPSGLRAGIITAVAPGAAMVRVQSLAGEFPHAVSEAKKKKKKKKKSDWSHGMCPSTRILGSQASGKVPS